MEKATLVRSDSPEQSERVARAFASVLRGGEVVSLEGELGAGKTFFVRAMARALGVREHVTSPTFVLQKSYAVPSGPVKRLVHYDVYRMASYGELLEIGFEELPEDAVALVEWGDRFQGEYAMPLCTARFEYGEGDESRRMRFVFPEQATQAQFEKALSEQGTGFTRADA